MFVTRQGQRVLVQFTSDVTIGAARSLTDNVVSISGGAAQAELVVAAGSILHKLASRQRACDRRPGP